MKTLFRAAIGSLLLSSAAGAQRPAVIIHVWSFGFAPKPVHLEAGRPVTLTFVNGSGAGHDFTAREFFTKSTILEGDARGGEVELRPHETKSVTLVPLPGRYRAHCSHFFHKQMGMSDEIIVE